MKKKVRMRPKFYLLLIAAMLVFFSFSCAVSQFKINELSRRADVLRREKEEKEVQVGRLNEKLMYVRSDEYIIRVAREEAKLIMPGEIRYMAN